MALSTTKKEEQAEEPVSSEEFAPEPEKAEEPKKSSARKSDEKYTLQHPTIQGSGSFGVYIPLRTEAGNEYNEEVQVEFKEGKVVLEKTPKNELIKNALLRDGFSDQTYYALDVAPSQAPVEVKKMASEWTVQHPDHTDAKPINASIGLYDIDKNEKTIQVENGRAIVKDHFILNQLESEGWQVVGSK